jgi:hypothetical protein
MAITKKACPNSSGGDAVSIVNASAKLKTIIQICLKNLK